MIITLTKRIVCKFSNNSSSLRLPSFTHFDLYPKISDYLTSKQIHTPTYIQYALLSSLSKNENSLHHITSPTGSGKTLAYLLPIINSLKKQQKKEGAALTISQRPRALILTTNKELVLQCKQAAKEISHFCKFKCEGIGIGRSLSQQKRTLMNGVDILCATYPRFDPMLKRNLVFLSNIKWIVVDQVDTLFETGRFNSINNNLLSLIEKLKEKKNIEVILSGTTKSSDLRKFIKDEVTAKSYIDLVDKNTHINLENIKHEFVQLQSLDKHFMFIDLFNKNVNAKTIVFCNTVKSLHDLTYFLESQGIRNILTLHSQLSKQIRLQNYSLFRDSQASLLICTDLGARGLDFPNVVRVINYDFPSSTCDYLQRVGRTGRAGKKGLAQSLFHKKNLSMIRQLQDASFERPLKISNSAYGLKNREQLNRGKFQK